MTRARTSGAEQSSEKSNVLPTLFNKWVSHWLERFQRSRTQPTATTTTTTATATPPRKATVHVLERADTTTSQAAENLLKRDAPLLAELAQWTERCESAEVSVDRARQRVNKAAMRLQQSGDSIPDEVTGRLSALQESYHNFNMLFALHEQALARAKRKVALIQQQRTDLVADRSAPGVAPSDHSMSEHDEALLHRRDGEFRDAA